MSNYPQNREAAFANIELVNGCHHFAALDVSGEWINSCIADAYGIELISYADDYADIIGKRAQFVFEDGVLNEIRSVEGYTADQILAVKLRQTLRLSPLDWKLMPIELAIGRIMYGTHKSWHDRFRRRNTRHKQGKLALTSVGHITYLVQDLGVVELATPIWLGQLGQLPADIAELDTDDKVLVFEQRCHDLGNIARSDPNSLWVPPTLDTRPRLEATPPLTL